MCSRPASSRCQTRRMPARDVSRVSHAVRCARAETSGEALIASPACFLLLPDLLHACQDSTLVRIGQSISHRPAVLRLRGQVSNCNNLSPGTSVDPQSSHVRLTWMTNPAEMPATAPCGGQKLPSQLCAELASASTTLIGLSATHSGRGFSLCRLLWGYSSTLSL